MVLQAHLNELSKLCLNFDDSFLFFRSNFIATIDCVATLSEIQSPVWTLSIDGGGAIAQGVDAIRQCIDIIVRTSKGSDPLRPLFGCDVLKWIDSPINVAIPNMKKAILEAISLWEPRVKISSIKHQLVNNSNLQFNIFYGLTDDSLQESIIFLISNGGIISTTGNRKLILQGLFPPNPSNGQYQISAVLNNNELLPLPPVNGFTSLNDLYNWVQNNWSAYGQWYLTGSAIIGYINSNYTTGSITLIILPGKTIKQLIPGLPTSNKYVVTANVDGSNYSSTSDLFTAEDIRSWAQSDPVLCLLGTWSIESNDGSFNDDFSDDFDTSTQYLVLVTNSQSTITINITTASV